jgi:vacuole membrane protein 1
LHTFVLYLGPHVALFTIKAVHCGRVDLKSAPYDTILLKRSPSWLEKDCLEFGPPIYKETITFSKILQEVYLEDILWGIGTTLGELPPYFLSRAGFIHTALQLATMA